MSSYKKSKSLKRKSPKFTPVLAPILEDNEEQTYDKFFNEKMDEYHAELEKIEKKIERLERHRQIIEHNIRTLHDMYFRGKM